VLSGGRYHLKGNNSVNENNQMNLTVFVWLAFAFACLACKAEKQKKIARLR